MERFEDLPLTLKMGDVAKVLGVSKRVAYDLARQNDFPAVRVGGKRIIVPRDLLRQWLENQAGGI